mgnify:CR=1 FL=1
MAEHKMTEDRLINLIETYGGDPDHWPDQEAEAGRDALALARRLPSRALATALAEADAVDRALGRLEVPQASPGLTSRILAEAPRAPAASAWRPLPTAWRQVRRAAAPALAAAACLTLGLVGGLRLATPSGDTTTDGEAYVLAALGLDDRLAWLEEVEE